MTPTDETELHRLCDTLRGINRSLERTSTSREALQKAIFALGLAFIHGLRPDIENLNEQRDAELTDAQKEHLRSMGIDPEAPAGADANDQ